VGFLDSAVKDQKMSSTEPEPSPAVSLPSTEQSLRNKDYEKFERYFIQAVCGPYMAIYRGTGHLPTTEYDAMQIHSNIILQII
jgi:hypothetical protein